MYDQVRHLPQGEEIKLLDAENKLIDLRGIARLLGVSPYTPQQWRERDQLPAPDEDFPGKPLWRAGTIVKWAQDTERWPPGKAARGPRRRKPAAPAAT